MLKIIIIGFGSNGQALIPLLRDAWPQCEITAIDKSFNTQQKRIAHRFDIKLIESQITRANYQAVLTPFLQAGNFLLNMATEISSEDLICLAQAHDVHYVDTCIDPWDYECSQQDTLTSNYSLRENLKALSANTRGKATAIVAHGANPGFVSILVKRGLEMMAQRFLPDASNQPSSQAEWAQLAQELGIRVIQISERDTQVGRKPRRKGEFVCTWSVPGLITECLQPAELGWGSHEKNLPPNAGTHSYGSQAAIYLDQPSFTVRIKSWSPNYLDFVAYLLTHNEAITIADYFTCHTAGEVTYRPTCYYAYHPCDDTVASMSLLEEGITTTGSTANAMTNVQSMRVLKDDIISGIDELGVFLISEKYPCLWLGSNLSIGKARKQAPYNNATSLQVVSSVVAGMQWMQRNPRLGLVESEAMDHEFIFNAVEPYWSPMVAQFIHWRPRSDSDSLQFEDFRQIVP